MNAEEHNKTLGTLYFVYAAIHGLTLLGLLGLVLIFKFASVAGDLISGSWMIVGSFTFVVLMLAVGILPLLVGVGFRKRQAWVKPLGIGVAIISLVNIPIGTALGIYTIKFFRSDAGVQIYGGKARGADANELESALGRAKPLTNVADHLK
jgi:putative Mn2+ efflux pump MntP